MKNWLVVYARLHHERWNSALPSLAPGEWVKIIKGPLTGLKGELVTVGGKSKMIDRLYALGCAQVAIPPSYVEKFEARAVAKL